MLQKKIYVVLLFFVWVGSARLKAQCSFSLNGMVTDAITGETLAGAAIFCEALKKGEVCNEKGHFHFKGLCGGEYQFVVRVLGYEEMDTVLKVPAPQEIVLSLRPMVKQLDEVNVSGEKLQELSSIPQYTLVIANPAGKTLGESLQSLTGVSLLKTGSTIAKPVVHGLHSQRLLILNNGIRQEGQQWGNEHAPEIDVFLASHLTLVKGAASVQYGADAIGGVILVEPAPLPYGKRKLGGRVHTAAASNGRLMATSAVAEGAWLRQQGAWRIQGTFKQSGNVRTPHYYLMNTGSKEYNFSATIGVKKQTYGVETFYSQFNTNIGIFRGAHIGNLQDLLNAIASERPLYQDGFTYRIQRPRQEVQHQLAKTTVFWQVNDRFKISWVNALQQNRRAEYDAHRAFNATLDRPQMQLNLQTATSDLSLEHATQAWSGKIGASFLAQRNRYEGSVFIPNYRALAFGLFWIERWQKNRWELETGVRYDYRWMRVVRWSDNVIVKPEYLFHNVSATGGINYQATPTWRWSLNLGTAWRPPHVSELFSAGLHHGMASVEIGNSSLTTEKALKAISSIKYQSKNERLNLELDAYIQHIWDYIYLRPVFPPTLTIRGAFPTFAYTQVDVLFSGLDTKITYDFLKNLEYEAKLSVVRAVQRTSREHLLLIPPDRYEHVFRWKGTSKRPSMVLSMLQLRKQWRVPPQQDYAPPPKGVVLFNLLAEQTFSLSSQQFIEIGMGVENLLNTVYRDYMNRFRYFADEMGRNISLKARYTF